MQSLEQEGGSQAAAAVGRQHAEILDRSGAAALAHALDRAAVLRGRRRQPGGLRTKAGFAANLAHEVATALACAQAGKNTGVDFLDEAAELDLGMHFKQRILPGHEEIAVG